MEREKSQRYLDIRDKMVELIRNSGMKVAKISKILGISQPSMSAWMSGKTSMSLESFILLSDLFGVHILFPEGENADSKETVGALKIALEQERQKVIKLEGQVEVLQGLLHKQMQLKLEIEQGDLLKIK